MKLPITMGYVCVYFNVCVCMLPAAAVVHRPGTGDNVFVRTHQRLYGNRTICYPVAQSVESLFIATPGWQPQQLYTVDISGSHCKGQIGYFKFGKLGKCVELREPTASTEAKPQRAAGVEYANYSKCFQGVGWGCVHAQVPKSDPCVQTQCVQQHCRAREGQLTCTCQKQECVKVTVGRQLMCGMCNGTHVGSTFWDYPIDQLPQQGSNGESGKGGNWNHSNYTTTGHCVLPCQTGICIPFRRDLYYPDTEITKSLLCRDLRTPYRSVPKHRAHSAQNW